MLNETEFPSLEV